VCEHSRSCGIFTSIVRFGVRWHRGCKRLILEDEQMKRSVDSPCDVPRPSHFDWRFLWDLIPLTLAFAAPIIAAIARSSR
jgi:hypothetical protein